METIPAVILVIENHPMMRATLCAAIAGEPGLTIFAIAANIADVLKMVDLQPPDLILFSVGNPGWEEISTLQSLHKALPATSILALISNEVQGQEQDVLKAGAEVVLTKSAPRKDLLNVLREMQTNIMKKRSSAGYERGTLASLL